MAKRDAWPGDFDVLVQEYVPGQEFGIFYYRYPGQERGRILSIVEETDTVAGSCTVPFEKSRIEPRFHEITIHTGRGHGAFYAPVPDWMDPVVRWASAEEP